jgi:hypothetical protein
MLKFLILGAAGVLIAPGAWSAAPQGDDTALTIYSSARPGAIPPEYYRPLPGQGAPNASGVPGYAMVRHERTVQLAAGRSQLQFTDVAALIDPTTVTFSSLTEPGTRVLEQNFQFDLVSTEKLMLKYLDRSITVERSNGGGAAGSVTGTLLSSADGLVLRGADGTITALRDYSALRFPELPGGLISRPTLLWDIAATRGGEHRARVTYQTVVTWWVQPAHQDGGYRQCRGPFRLGQHHQPVGRQLSRRTSEAHRRRRARAPLPVRVRHGQVRWRPGAGFEGRRSTFHLYTLGRRIPERSTSKIGCSTGRAGCRRSACWSSPMAGLLWQAARPYEDHLSRPAALG